MPQINIVKPTNAHWLFASGQNDLAKVTNKCVLPLILTTFNAYFKVFSASLMRLMASRILSSLVA